MQSQVFDGDTSVAVCSYSWGQSLPTRALQLAMNRVAERYHTIAEPPAHITDVQRGWVEPHRDTVGCNVTAEVGIPRSKYLNIRTADSMSTSPPSVRSLPSLPTAPVVEDDPHDMWACVYCGVSGRGILSRYAERSRF